MLWVAVVVGICAAQVLYPDGFVGYGTYLLVTVGAAVAAALGARRQPFPQRLAWTFIAVGLGCSAVGDGVYSLIVLFSGRQPEVSVADALWLAAYVGLAVGLSSLILGGGGWRRLDMDGLIDMGSFAVLAAIIVMQFTFVRDLTDDTSVSAFTRMVWAVYPVFDVALLALIAQAIVGRRVRGRSGFFVSCGVTLWLISDFGQLINDVAVISVWWDAGWMLGAASLAASAWPARRSESVGNAPSTAVQVTGGRIGITLVPLLVPGIIAIWDFSIGRHVNPLPLSAATLVLVVLAYARSTRLVKARNRQEAALEHSTQYYSALAENSSDAVIVVGADGQISNEAPNLAAMLGRHGEPTSGMDVLDLLNPFDRADAQTLLARWRSTTGVVTDAEVRATQTDGSDRWFGVRAVNLSNNPVVGGMVINLRDITDRMRAEQQLSHNAFHDSLTGLANRALFQNRLEHALERRARTNLGVAIVYVDLDGFKMVNDGRGHEAGDKVLREVAIRLSGVVRTLDTVSRLAGDEFAILIEDSPRALDEAQTIADRVLQSLTVPFDLGGQQVVLSASIGIAIGDVSCTASSLLRDAEVAMYKAKTTGKSTSVLYDPAMRTAGLERLQLDSDLRQVLSRRQLRLAYQPIVELESRVVCGFEALLRWDHPTLGDIQPETFIPIAEGNGTIVAIGQWVLEEACRTAEEWQRAYPSAGLTMAVNMSARQIATPDIVDQVATALDRSGFAPASLILEMTEGVLVQDAEIASQRLHALRALGVRLAIDDFGTGYSSLSYLRQFPIDILKIDKSFTYTITDRLHIPPIVRGLLDLAKTLHLETVAEGIELDVQLDGLCDQHCDFGQGFLFARPLSYFDASALLARYLPAQPMPVGSH